jgi:hypothetical protein
MLIAVSNALSGGRDNGTTRFQLHFFLRFHSNHIIRCHFRETSHTEPERRNRKDFSASNDARCAAAAFNTASPIISPLPFAGVKFPSQRSPAIEIRLHRSSIKVNERLKDNN